jgi:hypothetical protein
MKKARFVAPIVLVLLVVGVGGLFAAKYVYHKIRGDNLAPAIYAPPPDPSEPGVHVRFRENDLLNYETPLGDLLESPVDKDRISLLIEKPQYRLTVLYDGRPVKQYPVVFGGNPVDDKLRQGDGCTPEGQFIVQDLYPHGRYYRFLWLNYPNDDSWSKHDQAIADGIIPADSPIGSDIGIHCEADDDIDYMVNCTAGCIAMRKWDVGEVYDVSGKGTPVEIRH